MHLACIFNFFPVFFNWIRHLKGSSIACTCRNPGLAPLNCKYTSQNCICVSCPTEHVKIQIHLAEKFCSQLLAWQGFGWGGKGQREGGGRDNFPSNGEKQFRTFIINGLDIAGANGNNMARAREPFTNKTSPAFISIMVAMPSFLWWNPDFSCIGFLLLLIEQDICWNRQVMNEIFWINQHLCWRENGVLFWSSKNNWLCFRR